MRAFIVLGFLLAAANAGSLGYNYAPGVQTTSVIGGSGGLISSGSNRVITTGSLGGGLVGGGLVGGGLVGGGLVGGGLVGSGLSGGVTHLGGSHLVSSGNLGGGLVSSGLGGGLIRSGGSHILGSGHLGSGFIGNGGLVSSSGYGSGYSGGATVIGLDALDNVPQTVELSKQYFFFDAPEEPYNEGAITKQISNVLKKNLQVVFIKAPENNAATSAALQLAKQAIEQRTAIYVLTKETDGNQFVAKLQQIQESVPTAPEVRFIKYRTPEDIAYAKQIIQSQYDQLGGFSESYNGGVAPVLNYASQRAGGAIFSSGLGSLGGGTVLSGGGYTGGSLLSSGLGSYGGGTILSGGLGSGSLGGGTILSGGGLSGIGGSKTVVSKVIESSNYLPPALKK